MKNENLQRLYNDWHTNVYQSSVDFKIDPRTERTFNALLDYLDEKKEFKKGKKILDVACGKGMFLDVAKKKNLDVFGLDISDIAIKRAKQRIPEGKFVVGSGEEMPYQNEEFDYITCLGSLEHFPSPSKGISEISRVLKRDGVAMIYVPNLMFIGHIYMTKKYGIMPSEGQQSFSEVFYTYKGWEELLDNNGLHVEDCKAYNRIYGTSKVSKFTIFLWEKFLRFLVPFHLSYIFVFICRKK